MVGHITNYFNTVKLHEDLDNKNIMGLNDWLAILGALGGLEAVKWVVNFYVNRKTNARKEDAAADAAENENERKQVVWLEERVTQRDMKIDGLYAELRQEQKVHIETIHRLHEVELQLKEAELSRCDLWECLKRIPPKFKNRTEEVQQ